MSRIKTIAEIAVILILVALIALLGRPRLATYYNNKGVIYYNNGQYEEAIDYLNRSLRLQPQAVAYYSLANIYAKQQSYDRAVEEYKRAIERDPYYADAYMAISDIYSIQENYEEALNTLKKAQQKIPADNDIKGLYDKTIQGYATYYLNKGLLSLFAGDEEDAGVFFNKAIDIKPDFAYAHYLLGYYRYKIGNFNDAVSELKAALEIDPNYSDALQFLGDIYFEKGYYPEAIQAYKRILELGDNNALVYNAIGITLMQMERYREAVSYLRESLALAPGNADVRYNLASTYRDAGMLDEAIYEYKTLESQRPDYPNIHNNLAYIYNLKGDTEKAAEEYRKEIEYSSQRLLSNPGDVTTLNNLAKAYNGIKEYQKAQEIIEDVIKEAPDYRDAYLTLADIKENTGNHKESLDALVKAKALSAGTNFIDKKIISLREEPEPVITDKVYLKNGRVIEGIIKEKTDKRVVLEIKIGSSEGEISLQQEDIERIAK